jgi:hypothetical protein
LHKERLRSGTVRCGARLGCRRAPTQPPSQGRSLAPRRPSLRGAFLFLNSDWPSSGRIEGSRSRGAAAFVRDRYNVPHRSQHYCRGAGRSRFLAAISNARSLAALVSSRISTMRVVAPPVVLLFGLAVAPASTTYAAVTETIVNADTAAVLGSITFPALSGTLRGDAVCPVTDGVCSNSALSSPSASEVSKSCDTTGEFPSCNEGENPPQSIAFIVTSVPEPATGLLGVTGFLGLGAWRLVRGRFAALAG